MCAEWEGHARRRHAPHGPIPAGPARRKVPSNKGADGCGGSRCPIVSVSADTFGSEPSYDTVINVYRGTSLGSLTFIDCNDDAAGTSQSQVSWSAMGGRTYYYIQITGLDNGDYGELVFALTRN